MQLRTASLLTALLLPLVAMPTIALGSSPNAVAPNTMPTKPSDGAQAEAPIHPEPGTCTIDDSDPNYTCKICTSEGGTIETTSCTAKKKKKPVAVFG